MVKLPRTVSGEELAAIVEASMKDLDGFNLKVEPTYGYISGSVKEAPSEKRITVKQPISLRRKIIDFCIPVLGWMKYSLEDSPEGRQNFYVRINMYENYDTINILARRYGYNADNTTEGKFQKYLKQDFEKLVAGIYTRLGVPVG